MTEQELAEDVARTVERIKVIILDLKQRHRDVLNLELHLAYNWRVAKLLEEAESD